MGIPLTAGAVDPELQQLAMRARSGDKHAQLDLGIRFEEGHGVVQNLLKARDLYFAAATERGAARLIVIPTSSGDTRVPIIMRRSRVTATGLAEAALRWDRIARQLAPIPVTIPRNGPEVTVSGFDFGELISARKELDFFHSESLLFPALKASRGVSLDLAMMQGAGAILLTPDGIDQTVKYAAAAAPDGEVAPESFCRSHLDDSDLTAPASFRIAALCAVKLCRQGAPIDWARLTDGIPAPVPGAAFDREAAEAFGSAGFAMRVLAYCGRTVEANRAAQRVWEHLSHYRQAAASCLPTDCSTGQLGYALELARSGNANILVWAIENGQLRDPHVTLAIAIWNRGIPTDPFSGPERNAQFEALCNTMELDYAACRASYRYDSFLEGRLFELLDLLIRTAAASERDNYIQRFSERYAVDIEARGVRAMVDGLSTGDDNRRGS
ncbi:hypothetical protein [Novosphingobium sp. CF614]|uniref:hypothetical protein n=1 Tax=Novosphingobium sp. CF614 TaxID=1884364 RepID=UPI001160D6A2|nr:hypothetical protein [Novosphingobium sp. CF614]